METEAETSHADMAFDTMMQSLSVLGISVNDIHTMTLAQLKRIYYAQALKTHPDKCSRPDAAAVFVQVESAYKFLKAYIDPEVAAEEAESKEEVGVTMSFTSVVDAFIRTTFNGDADEGKLAQMIRHIAQLCISKTPALLHTLIERKIKTASQQTCAEMYAFLSKYQEILGLREETLEILQNAIHSRHETTDVITLRPSIDDLLQHRVYSELQVPGGTEMLAVPLWNTNVQLEFRGRTPDHKIFVTCSPVLPPNITRIDEDNNIYCDLLIDKNEDILKLFSSPPSPLYLTLGRHRFQVPTDKLLIMPDQVCILKEKGISRQDKEDPFYIGKKNDIYVRIRILPQK